jgi:hypothetical protein
MHATRAQYPTINPRTFVLTHHDVHHQVMRLFRGKPRLFCTWKPATEAPEIRWRPFFFRLRLPYVHFLHQTMKRSILWTAGMATSTGYGGKMVLRSAGVLGGAGILGTVVSWGIRSAPMRHKYHRSRFRRPIFGLFVPHVSSQVPDGRRF